MDHVGTDQDVIIALSLTSKSWPATQRSCSVTGICF